jgi:hypothetical protein
LDGEFLSEIKVGILVINASSRGYGHLRATCIGFNLLILMSYLFPWF